MFISSVILDDLTDKVSEVEERVDLYQAQILELHKKKTKGLIDQNEYLKLGSKLASMIESVKNEINAIESSYSSATLANRRVEEILNILNSLEPTEELDNEIFKRLFESVTINDRCKITFKFKVGLERT